MIFDADVLVVGGGVSGLCAAGLLTEKLGAAAVLTLEKQAEPGGTTGSDRMDGFICDWGSNGFLDREPLTLEWVNALGLTGELVKANKAAAKRFIFRHGKLHQVKAPPGFFTSPLLSVPGRLRLCCEPLIPGKNTHDEESIYDFAARRIGREAAEIMVGAMVLGIYGGDVHTLSMEHCFPRMVAMERDYGGLFKALLAIRKQKKNASPMGPPGTLTTFREGIGALPCAAARRLGDRIRFNCSVRGISRDNEGFVVHLSSGEQYLGKAVLIAVPAFAAADLMHELHPSLAHALSEIPYAGLAVVCAGYAREKVAHDMDGFGFLAPRGQAMRMLGCIWTSSLFPFQCPEGRVLVRAMYGGAPDPEALSLSDAALTDLLKQELNPLLHIQGEPEFIRIYRHPKGIPQYTLGHAARLTAVDEAEQAMPGLAITGNAYRGIGLNDCVVSAHRAVEKLLKYLDA